MLQTKCKSLHFMLKKKKEVSSCTHIGIKNEHVDHSHVVRSVHGK
jgi:hypothetical protein